MGKLPGGQLFRNMLTHRALAVGLSFLLTLVLSGQALGQQAVSGTVSGSSGGPLRGVTVRVQGSELRTTTDANGKFTITAPADATLNFAIIGRRAVTVQVQNRSTVNVTMEPVAFLEEVVVTAYTEQRRADITGAVGSMNVESASRQTGASVLQKLDAAVPGITVEASGSPGSRSTVRVRGISSFQNNDPLYIVDGTPVQDSYINWLNPNDITSVQVLKDASASSIYGSRASNGVIIIETTKKGVVGPPRATLRVRTGMNSAVKGYDDMLILNSLDYFQIVKQSVLNAGAPFTIDSVPTNIYGNASSPSVPKYIFPNNCNPNPCQNPNLANYAYPGTLIIPGSAGTNWWKEVFGPAFVGDYNLDVSGGGEDNAYGLSFNFYNQQGTAKYNDFKRGNVRVNTLFNRNKLNFGENIAVSADRHYGGLPDDPGGYAEDGILGKNILMQPVVPVYDIKGNFASGKAPTLGNQSNPLKFAYEHRDDINRNERIFGNVFAGYDVSPTLGLRTRLGFNLAEGAFSGFNPIFPENSEANFTNSINENNSRFTSWTWSNTAKIDRKFFDSHNVSVLLGQEASASTNRFLQAGMSSLINTDIDSRYIQDALGDAASKTVSSTGSRSALLSIFGKADYNYADKYVASFTLRKDGSSNLSPDNRWGTFPAFGLGWRVTREPFFANNKFISDAMLRFGWGVTGNQQIPSGRIVSQYGGSVGDTYYDIGGTNSAVAGFRKTSLGNPNLKWEENRSINVGADLALFSGKIQLIVDVYQRKTNNLLFDPPIPATAGIADPPIVNIGKMQNNGFDFSIGHNTPTWSATWNFSHYANKIVSIDGVQDFFYGPISTRYGNQVINQVGHPIGSFYGLIADGMFRDAADVASWPAQDGKAPGRIRFRDINGDGAVTLADRTIIGSPHPDFTTGLDLSYRRGSWDLSGTLFGSFGNDIFDVQKEFYVFRNFSTNVRKDLLTDSWRPVSTAVARGQYTAQNPNAKYPILDFSDTFSHAVSSYYVEDGSYVRLRNLQLGYNVPANKIAFLNASRVYIQAENVLTFTGYSGLDPVLPAAQVTGPAGDIRDQYRGIDRGNYPSNRTFAIGVVTSF